jgi:hypothetical protein
VDRDLRRIDLGLVEILDAVRASEPHRGPRRSRARQPAARGRRSRPGRREREAKKRRR